MPLRRPSVSRKIGKHRFAILEDMPYGYREAQSKAEKIRKQGYQVRIVGLQTGWFIYHYPQYPQPKA